MGKEGTKTTFCQSNKCSFLVFVLLVGAIAAVVCVTLLVHDLRDIYDHGEGNHRELPWWKTTIIYQIYPRSFQDSDGDGVGDIQGIISRLWYFNYLNVGAIWLSPFFKSPMRDFGYDVSNYTDVDPIFGDMEDFDELMTEAKSKGIKVIIDFVPNHTSNESDWFTLSRNSNNKDDPYWDFYIWNEGVTYPNGTHSPPNNWKSVFGGSAWTWDDVRQSYYYHAFLASQPDLNYRSKHVLDKMDEVIKFWLDKGVDGLRIDAIPHLFEDKNQSINELPGATNGFNPNLHKYTKNQPEIFPVVKRWRAILDSYTTVDGNSRFLLAETVGIPQEARMEYYKAGSVPFFFDLIPAKETCNATASCVLDIISQGVNLTEGQWPNFVVGNHDSPRVADRIGDAYVDAINMMLLTLPGTPTTYYGEELGMRGGNYTGMPPKDPYAITSNNPVERNVTASSLSLYRRLAEIRQLPAFRNDYIQLPRGVGHILVYVRGEQGNRYGIALNLGTTRMGINIKKFGYNTGTLIFSTKSKQGKKLDLSNIRLDVGEGVIAHLDE